MNDVLDCMLLLKYPLLQSTHFPQQFYCNVPKMSTCTTLSIVSGRVIGLAQRRPRLEFHSRRSSELHITYDRETAFCRFSVTSCQGVINLQNIKSAKHWPKSIIVPIMLAFIRKHSNVEMKWQAIMFFQASLRIYCQFPTNQSLVCLLTFKRCVGVAGRQTRCWTAFRRLARGWVMQKGMGAIGWRVVEWWQIQ